MPNKSLRILSSLILCVVSQVVYGQLNYLTTGASNNADSYNDLGTSGSIIITANFDDDNSAPQNIGFTFKYNGSSFTQFILNTNGFIKLGNSDPSIPNLFFTTGSSNIGGVFNSTAPADSNILSVFNHDLEAGTGTPEYRIFTSGLAGTRVCTIQYKNVRDKTTSPAVQYDNMQFQIKLYETTNTIEFIYGTWAPSTNSTAIKSAAIGLKGINNSNAQLLAVGKVSTQSWSTVSFIAGNYTGINAFKFGNPTKPSPDAGRTFRFIQAFPNDLNVHLFTLGSMPNPFGAPRVDSAAVRNIGINTLTNIAVTLNITGANTFTDNKIISSLAPGDWATIGFSPYSPSASGINNVSVSIPSDADNTNNTDVYTQIVNNTIFSYADAGKAEKKGIGSQYNPGYLVVKYSITGTTSVAGANIYIAGDSASINKGVYAILFDGLGNRLDSSSVYTITVSDTGKYHTFSLPLTTISNSSFYIGLAQPTLGFKALGCQNEKPVRSDAYFIRDMNSAFFTDLGGLGSLASPYRLMIQAIITNTTGILKNISENTIVVYPNPFNNTTTFDMQAGDVTDACFNLYDVTGRIVKTIKNINTPQFKIEKEYLQNGIYFYTLNDADKLIGSGKLVIE
ncbi:MAG: T9SS type A sorting domain-containing protein [Bacteroidetes bacterium]|nr:T9SS type A sorting domain-containing protein [Bacteroidota bacterium]